MRHRLKRPRAFIIALLSVSVVAPVVFLYTEIVDFTPSIVSKGFFDDVPAIARNLPPAKVSTDALKVKSIEEDLGDGLKEPERTVLDDKDPGNLGSSGNASSKEDTNIDDKSDPGAHHGNSRSGEMQQQNRATSSDKKMQARANGTNIKEITGCSHSQLVTDEKVRTLEDMLIMARAYLHFAPANSNSRLVRELKLRIKEIERIVGHASKDSDLSRSALQKMRAMETTLSKANKSYPDCSAMVSKLHAMTYDIEEQLRAQKNHASHLTQLAARTFPKGLHCLSMLLISEYFALQPEERDGSSRHNVQNPKLYHYAIFSDNVLACAVVVNSTISKSEEPDKIVFHVVTDSLNFPAMKMWFLMNPPSQATVQIENFDDFKWLPPDFSKMFKQSGVQDPRYSSALNHLRFYLPDVFPALSKVLLLDHDVVVQGDLRGLWDVDLKGKVNGAVEACGGESSCQLESLVNFSDSIIVKSFDPKKCVWAFGTNIFDLRAWRRHSLTKLYHKWLQEGKKKQLWKAGSLPIGQLIFYNQTVAIDRQWHVLGLGFDSSVTRNEIERGAVIHYNGIMKPWLDIAIPKYKGDWTKFVDYNNPYLQQCNIGK